ncbi:hypothetical protein [Azospirillum thermophilum]|uniref:Uncharacterized protein n=1 Tax=Azospirillum thermophilum TaxID=2202148 RepID=A0A2S2CR20_9PROT|nr:hypothetical protein [Azospirillum thermophilum]AWK86932.1 hypothetical protein DEW08_12450 [Azospirillum thermophilum]
MGSASLTALVITASVLGSVAVDVGMNTLQDWYQTFYADALWGNRPATSELDHQLRKEEAEIDRLMREDNFIVEEAEAR